jgi:hypothetical protein
MELLKKYCKANSILESVIALSIISVCLYVAILVYASVFTPRTSPKFYNTSNKLDEVFFLMQVQNDSVNDISSNQMEVEEEIINTNLKAISLKFQDSSKIKFEKKYYIHKND